MSDRPDRTHPSLPHGFTESIEDAPREPTVEDYRAAQKPARARRTLSWRWKDTVDAAAGGVVLASAFAGFMATFAALAVMSGNLGVGLVSAAMALFIGGMVGMNHLNRSTLTIDSDTIRHRVTPWPTQHFEIPRRAVREIRLARGPRGRYLAQLVHEDGVQSLPSMNLFNARELAGYLSEVCEVELLDPIAEAEALTGAQGPKVRVDESLERWRSSASDDERRSRRRGYRGVLIETIEATREGANDRDDDGFFD